MIELQVLLLRMRMWNWWVAKYAHEYAINQHTWLALLLVINILLLLATVVWHQWAVSFTMLMESLFALPRDHSNHVQYMDRNPIVLINLNYHHKKNIYVYFHHLYKFKLQLYVVWLTFYVMLWCAYSCWILKNDAFLSISQNDVINKE